MIRRFKHWLLKKLDPKPFIVTHLRDVCYTGVEVFEVSRQDMEEFIEYMYSMHRILIPGDCENSIKYMGYTLVCNDNLLRRTVNIKAGKPSDLASP